MNKFISFSQSKIYNSFMGNFGKILKYLIGWPLAFVALFFVARIFLNQKNLFAHITSLNYFFLVLSFVLFVLFFFLRALFWQKLLQKKDIKFPYKTTALTWGMAEFTRYVPGSIWPILGRSSAYEKLGSEKKHILTSIFHESQFLIISCLLLSLSTLNFLFYGFIHISYAPFFIMLSVAATLLITILFLFHSQIFPKKFFLQHLLPRLPFADTLQLLLISTVSFLLFGLANYFAFSALSPLYLLHILPLVGFFVFAFIAGYLSFLAPMGLGVREAILTAGMAKYMPLSLAAYGSLLTRFTQIVSELAFLLLCILWGKTAHNKIIKRAEAFCLERKYEIAMILSIAAYISYFTTASFLRYTNFFTGRFDLGNMDQTVWNTIHGRIFQLTDPNGIATVSRLAFHADFMLILLSPLYAVWQDPRMLLLIQSVAIGCGGFFIYKIALSLLKKKSLAFAFVISYLLYPTLQYANLYDFHAVTLAVPFFLAGWYFILKKRFALAALMLILAATTKEQVWVMVSLFGLYFIFWKKKYILGTLLAVASITIFCYLIQYAIPAAHGSGHFALSYYSDFGSSPTSILRSMILSPIKTFSVLFGGRQLIYLLGLFGPLGFLSLLGLPILLFVAPDLGISLLSQNAQLHELYYHYGAIPTPFFFIAALYGFGFLLRWQKNIFSQYGVYFILIPAIVCAYIFGPLPGAAKPSIAMFTEQLSYAPFLDSFLASIPKRYSVAATNNIGSHLSHRQKIFTIPTGLKVADIVVFLLDDSYAQPSLKAQKEMAHQLDNDTAYVRLIAYQDFVVYKKKNVPIYSKKHTASIFPLFKGD